MTTMLENHNRIFLKNLAVEVSVGMHPWERHPERPTRLLINVEMWAPVAPVQGRPHVDYDIIRNAIKKWSLRPHVELLETLAQELVDICFNFATVDACKVSITKPDIFNEVEGVGVEFSRVRG